MFNFYFCFSVSCCTSQKQKVGESQKIKRSLKNMTEKNHGYIIIDRKKLVLSLARKLCKHMRHYVFFPKSPILNLWSPELIHSQALISQMDTTKSLWSRPQDTPFGSGQKALEEVGITVTRDIQGSGLYRSGDLHSGNRHGPVNENFWWASSLLWDKQPC